MTGDEAIPVQNAGDEIVIANQHQVTHGGNDVGGGAVALPPPSPGQAHLAVHAADPVDDENNLGRFRIDIGNYFMNKGAHDVLFQPRICCGRRPNGPSHAGLAAGPGRAAS
jgi:hypothetical protein